MLKIILFKVLFVFFISLASFAQSGEQADSTAIDTSAYIPGDINYNLLVAAYRGYSDEVLRLLREGAYVDYRSAEGLTALMYAMEFGYYQTAKILILNGADTEILDNLGRSPIGVTALFGDLEMAELLIREGADINYTDLDGRTPLMIASYFGYPTYVDMLLYYGARVNLTDNEGNTALNLASLTGNTEVATLLIKYGASFEKADKHGFTPMHAVAQNGHIAVMELLTEGGASPELKTNGGYTALAIAARNNQLPSVKYLIDANAETNSNIARGYNVLNLAKKYASDSISNLLKQNGATVNPWPGFHYSSVDFNFNSSGNDFFFGGGLSFHDTKYGLSAGVGYNFRVFAKAILVEHESNIYYQYWERRSFWYGNLKKTIPLYHRENYRTVGISLGGQAAFTKAKYRGVSERPESDWVFSPQAGLFLRSRNAFLFTLDYEYMNFELEKVSPHRINFGIAFLIRDKFLKSPTKKELWPEN